MNRDDGVGRQSEGDVLAGGGETAGQVAYVDVLEFSELSVMPLMFKTVWAVWGIAPEDGNCTVSVIGEAVVFTSAALHAPAFW